MFRNHPKGLFVLLFSNMGERFGYYTMMAILALFLQDHFGWDETHTSLVLGFFMMGSYILVILGGLIADTLLGYGRSVIVGTLIMIAGYALMAQPVGTSPVPVYIALTVISIGVGLFKGNLVVLIGNLYEKADRSSLRDNAFNIFYMGINVGAMFAPFAATGIKDYIMRSNGLTYDPAIPRIAHDVLNGAIVTPDNLEKIKVYAGSMENINSFAQHYIDILSRGYHWGFGIASIAIVISLIVFFVFRKHYKEADYRHSERIKTGEAEELSVKETRSRLLALGLVFMIVIFFWVAFQQNGTTLTFFAKNYTNLSVGRFTYLLFSVENLLTIFTLIIGIILIFSKNIKKYWKYIGGSLSLISLLYLIFRLLTSPGETQIFPELFQTFNPMFVVWLTPLLIGFFHYLRKKGQEPTTPAKIGIGMFVAAIAYGIMVFASLGLPSVNSIGSNVVSHTLAVTPYWLISSYFTITIAELCLSPMGLSFVSKVAPPKLKGAMQGGWNVALAIGNFLAGYVGRFYQNWELWQFFLMLVVMSVILGVVMFSLLNIINKASGIKH
jgi:POT family proton-dependent oligopeptide transporter